MALEVPIVARRDTACSCNCRGISQPLRTNSRHQKPRQLAPGGNAFLHLSMNDQARIHVLLVEGGQIDARLLRGTLAGVQDTEFIITHVETLAKAQTQLADESFDIVLLDLGLPDCSGIEAFHRVHRLRPDVPVIVLTEADDSPLALDAMRAGALDHLLKHQIQTPGLERALRYAVRRLSL